MDTEHVYIFHEKWFKVSEKYTRVKWRLKHKIDSTFHLVDQAQVKILKVPLDLFVDLLLNNSVFIKHVIQHLEPCIFYVAKHLIPCLFMLLHSLYHIYQL